MTSGVPNRVQALRDLAGNAVSAVSLGARMAFAPDRLGQAVLALIPQAAGYNLRQVIGPERIDRFVRQVELTSIQALTAAARPFGLSLHGQFPTLAFARPGDMEAIYRIRHDVYAAELGQHPLNVAERLTNELDDTNIYIVARLGDTLAGFISITPPGNPFSVERHFAAQRDRFPFAITDRTYEIRLLTVPARYRGRGLSLALMYAALRYVDAMGADRIVAMGRKEVVPLYTRVGALGTGLSITEGDVTFELMSGTPDGFHAAASADPQSVAFLSALERQGRWRLPIPFRRPDKATLHGGDFWGAIGPDFRNLKRRYGIIQADVLDAPFDPTPRIDAGLSPHRSWLRRTSPPTQADGVVAAVAQSRSIPTANILPAAGSSPLIFNALPLLLKPDARVLVMEPTYGEYAHRLRQFGYHVEPLRLAREESYALDLDRFLETVTQGDYDLVIMTNPNTPTGLAIRREELEPVLRRVPYATLVWIDNTYGGYATAAFGTDQFLDQIAASSTNLITVVSMSKSYALSGERAAYLAAPRYIVEGLRGHMSPWSLSNMAQIAMIHALADNDYYRARWSEAIENRSRVEDEVRVMGLEVNPGSVTHFFLAFLPEAVDPRRFEECCRERGLYLRFFPDRASLNPRAFRVVSRGPADDERMLEIMRSALERSTVES